MVDLSSDAWPAGSRVQRCRHCGVAITPEAEHFPFCSSRCRTADLAKWASEQYVISRPIEQADLDEGE